MVVLPVSWHLLITGWQDILEISLCTIACYYLSAWLKKDTQTPLLTAAYSYCTALFATYLLNLTTIHTALLTFTPLIVATFLMLHKQTLQKNFIALHRITPAKKVRYNWQHELVRTALISMNHEKKISFVIEKNLALDDLIHCEQLLDSSFSPGLAQLLLDHHTPADSFIWFNNNGTVCGYDCTFKPTSIDTWFAQETNHVSPFLHHALMFSLKIEIMFITTDPQSRTFTIIHEGQKRELVSARDTIETIKAYTGEHQSRGQGVVHETINHKRTTVQELQP